MSNLTDKEQKSVEDIWFEEKNLRLMIKRIRKMGGTEKAMSPRMRRSPIYLLMLHGQWVEDQINCRKNI